MGMPEYIEVTVKRENGNTYTRTLPVLKYDDLHEEAKARVRQNMFNNARRGGLYDDGDFDSLFHISVDYPEGTPFEVIRAEFIKRLDYYLSDDYVQECQSSGYDVVALEDGTLLDDIGIGWN